MIVRVIVTEPGMVRLIQFAPGLKSVTVAEIVLRFNERHVGFAVESPYYPVKVQQAAAALKEYLAERGHLFAKVATDVHEIPPHSINIVFTVDKDAK